MNDVNIIITFVIILFIVLTFFSVLVTYDCDE